jgi:hypothetical protein
LLTKFDETRVGLYLLFSGIGSTGDLRNIQMSVERETRAFMSLPTVGRHIVTMISAAVVACLCMESAAQAEIFDLACDRIDARNPVHYLYMIDTMALTVSDLTGPIEKRHTYRARITQATIDWTDVGGQNWHIDRLSGHQTLANGGGTYEFDCKRTQGL